MSDDTGRLTRIEARANGRDSWHPLADDVRYLLDRLRTTEAALHRAERFATKLEGEILHVAFLAERLQRSDHRDERRCGQDLIAILKREEQ